MLGNVAYCLTIGLQTVCPQVWGPQCKVNVARGQMAEKINKDYNIIINKTADKYFIFIIFCKTFAGTYCLALCSDTILLYVTKLTDWETLNIKKQQHQNPRYIKSSRPENIEAAQHSRPPGTVLRQYFRTHTLLWVIIHSLCYGSMLIQFKMKWFDLLYINNYIYDHHKTKKY